MTWPCATGDALAALYARVRETSASVGDRFPLFADPDTGRWKTTRHGSWTGGYWAGLLWLLAIAEHGDEDRANARRWSARLDTDTDTVTRGMTFWYGAAIGDVLARDESARAVAIGGARSLAAAYDPELGIVPTGCGLGDGAPGATIDGVVGLVPLLAWAADRCGDADMRVIAERHAARHVELCMRRDGSIRATANPRDERHEHHVHWARGQAWGMLAFTQAAQWLSGGYIQTATKAADCWLHHTSPTRAASRNLGDRGGPIDSSATAIAAVALLRLAALAPAHSARYRDAARETIATLTTCHLTPLDAADRRPRGVLLDGCYDPATGTATAHELIWGSFFLAQALEITTGQLDPLAL